MTRDGKKHAVKLLDTDDCTKAMPEVFKILTCCGGLAERKILFKLYPSATD
jgi:hypothetical protein